MFIHFSFMIFNKRTKDKS